MKTRALKYLGILLALVASGYFVAHASRALAGQNLSGLLDRQVLFAAAGLTALYTASIVTTALAWSRMLSAMKQPHPLRLLLPILAATQFGKYLPGNVAHHFGRVALARSVGIDMGPAILSISYELLLALVAAAHVGAITLLWAPPKVLMHWGLAEHRWALLSTVTLGAAAMLLFAPRIASMLMRLRSPAKEPTSQGKLQLDFSSAMTCYSLYMSGLFLIGFGLWLVAGTLVQGGTQLPGPLFFIGAFASSWILGFIAPGAPAGLGVREAMLSAWLSGVLPPAQAILLIVTLRIATTIGDLANFGWGSILLLRKQA